MIFDHLEERFFIQNKEISDFPNFRSMGTGDRGPGTRNRDQGRGQSQRPPPFDFSAISEFFEEMEKAKGGTFEIDDFRSF